jgi:hypothetical protein
MPLEWTVAEIRLHFEYGGMLEYYTLVAALSPTGSNSLTLIDFPVLRILDLF